MKTSLIAERELTKAYNTNLTKLQGHHVLMNNHYYKYA